MAFGDSSDFSRNGTEAASLCVAPGGKLIVADEIRAERPWQRALQLLARGPQWIFGWLLAGNVSQPVPGLRREVRATGFEVERDQKWLNGTLALYVASRPEAD